MGIKNDTQKSSFTLVEMLIVVVLIGILTTMAVLNYQREIRIVYYRRAMAQLQLLRNAVLDREMKMGDILDCREPGQPGGNSSWDDSSCNELYNVNLDTTRWHFVVIANESLNEETHGDSTWRYNRRVRAVEDVGGNCAVNLYVRSNLQNVSTGEFERSATCPDWLQ